MDSANAASAVSPTKNKSSLVQRIVSAIVLLPLVIALVWWNIWSVTITVAILTVVALLELYGAFAHGGYHPRVGVGLAVALGLVVAVAVRQISLLAGNSLDLLPLVLTLVVVVSLVSELRRHNHDGALLSWALTFAGAFYIGWLFSHFIMLRTVSTPLRPQSPLAVLAIEPGAAWLYTVLAVTWLQDTAAYFVGRSFGRHKMAPSLSPKKTWEGAIGGLLGSVVGGVVCMFLFGLPLGLAASVLLGIVGGVVGPLGDLSESLIKRETGIKDAGHLIPGHGGLLDRIDSLLFTGPVLFYLIPLLINS